MTASKFRRKRCPKTFGKHIIPDTCPYCYTVRDFAREHPNDTYLLKTSGHVIAVESGDYFDTSDSGSEIPVYYWKRRRVYDL